MRGDSSVFLPALSREETLRAFASSREPTLPLIQLRPDGCQAEPRDAVGLAAVAGDQAAAFQAVEDAHAAVREDEAVAGEAINVRDLAGVFVAAVHDAPTEGERMQHPLFVFRDVQVRLARC
jgi:hypothetical protein